MSRNVSLASAVALAVIAVAVTAGCSCSRQQTSTSRPPPETTRTAETTAPAPEPVVVWPLLGTRAPNAEAIRARVVSVKIENSPAARPQTGLASADVVYETITEGGITRYNALYHSEMPRRIGPVRSARLSDVFIVPQYRALFARIGGNFVTEAALRRVRVDDMNQFQNPAPYSRSSQRRSPHNLYVDLRALKTQAVRKGYAPTADPPALAFGAPPSAGATATVLDVPYTRGYAVRWNWAPGAKGYYRTLAGSRVGDTAVKGPYTARNVVVLFAETKEGRAIDSAGSRTLEITLAGMGRAVVFRDGKRFEGTWTAGRDAPPRFATSDGTPLPLTPGKTWIEVVPTGFPVSSR